MRVNLELYASLMRYLPPGSDRHRVQLEVEDGTSVQALIDRCRIPQESAHLVLRNGVFLHPAERAQTTLEAGDVIAMWPPVAGG